MYLCVQDVTLITWFRLSIVAKLRKQFECTSDGRKSLLRFSYNLDIIRKWGWFFWPYSSSYTQYLIPKPRGIILSSGKKGRLLHTSQLVNFAYAPGQDTKGQPISLTVNYVCVPCPVIREKPKFPTASFAYVPLQGAKGQPMSPPVNCVCVLVPWDEEFPVPSHGMWKLWIFCNYKLLYFHHYPSKSIKICLFFQMTIDYLL